MKLEQVPLYWRTLRHLRFAQFAGRLLHALPRRAPAAVPAPPLRDAERWEPPARREPSMLGPHAWRFLGETRDLPAPSDWDREDLAKLWRYNLHYFDDLNAQGSSERTAWHAAAISRWIAENPPVHGSGWEPYPVSLRIVNWIKWALGGGPLDHSARDSLACQVRWLTRRLEIHLLGNHLFANAKALVFAGLFFAGPEAEGWRKKGLSLLRREIREQVLLDGGHFERSTMYHALLLEDLLDLINVWRCLAGGTATTGTPFDPRLEDTIRYLFAMCHPDGEIALFNDAALGIAPSPQELLDYARRLGFTEVPVPAAPLTLLRDSGYARVQHGPACLFADLAPVGPDYLPGHAHADTLSFELSVFGQRVVVNSGTSCYGISDERLRQRGTAAHNTVQVDGLDSSEVWSGFRVGRRARPFGLSASDDDGTTQLACSHDGYRWLRGHPTHLRRWQMDDRSLSIEDRVDSSCLHRSVARVHFHPAAIVETGHDARSGTVRLPQGGQIRWTVQAAAATLEPSTYHPRFGAAESSCCLVIALQQGRAVTTFHWACD